MEIWVMPEFSQSSFEWPWNSELPCVLLESYEYHITAISCLSIFTAHQWSCGKVTFSLVSVCLFTRGGGLHVTITPGPLGHQPWDSPAQPPWTSAMETYPGPGPALLPATSGGHQWRPVQTCSFENPPWYWCLVAKAHTVGKWAGWILLECFLVLLKNFKHSLYLIYMKCNQKPLLLGKDIG